MFNISFFELSFLAEACVPPIAIARASFWQSLIDNHFYQMTRDERDRMFEWINRERRFQESLKKENIDCLRFNARFDKENNFDVELNNGEVVKDTFLWGGYYHTQCRVFLNKDQIKKTYEKN
jgi:hypothetical protein